MDTPVVMYWPLWSIVPPILHVISGWSSVSVWERTKLGECKRQRQLPYPLPMKAYWIASRVTITLHVKNHKFIAKWHLWENKHQRNWPCCELVWVIPVTQSLHSEMFYKEKQLKILKKKKTWNNTGLNCVKKDWFVWKYTYKWIHSE